MLKITLFIALVLIIICVVKSDQFTALEMHKLNRISGSVISNDNNYVVYTVRTWNATNGAISTHLEYTNIATQENTILTQGTSDYNPVFSPTFPDVVLFLSRSPSSGTVQLFYTKFPVNVTISTPVQVGDYGIDIDNLKINGKNIIFSAEIYVDCLTDVFKCTIAKNLEVSKRGQNTWGVYTKMLVRHWDRWLTEGKNSHVFTQSLDTAPDDVGTIIPTIGSTLYVDNLKGVYANSPVDHDGGAEQIDINAKGEVVWTQHDRTFNESWSTAWKIYTSGQVHLTEGITARTTTPKYSKDGNKIAYLAMSRNGLESDSLHLEIFNSFTQTIEKFTDAFDRSILDYMWFDDITVLFTATDLGVNKLYSVDVSNSTRSNSTITQIISDISLSVSAPLSCGGNKLVIARNSLNSPDELAFFTYDRTNRTSSTLIQITKVNTASLARFSFTQPESFTFKEKINNHDVQGWIMKPTNYTAGNQTYPLAFLIHGGPEGSFENSWSFRWNPQIWTNRGYVVVMINPHGSSGMGIDFQDAVRNDWGGVPYHDLMTGLDYVLATYPYVDGNRACACGASYGGYMVNWIQGNTNRFNCLVTHDGVFSTLTMFYATEEIWFPLAEYCPRNNVGCKPYEASNRKGYEVFSPETLVGNWQTPHLIIHGSNDFRIPIAEGLSAFSALQLKGVPSRFLHLTEENHWVLRAENSIKWYDEVIGWMDIYNNVKPTPPTPRLSFLE